MMHPILVRWTHVINVLVISFTNYTILHSHVTCERVNLLNKVVI